MTAVPPNRRVLFLAPQPFFKWRGTPIRVAADVRALAALGYEVDLLTMPIGDDKAIPGVRMRRVSNPFRLRELPIGPSLWKAVYDVILGFHALALAARHRYGIVHGVEEAGIIAAVLGKLFGMRSVFEKHSDPRSHRRGPIRNICLAIYAQIERLAARWADAVICTGPSLAEQARALAPRARIHSVPDLPSSIEEATPEVVAAVRAELRSEPEQLLVGYVGSFAFYQGIDLMFESMPAVLERVPHARFVIIGGTPGEILARRTWLARRGIEQAVSFLGKIHPDKLPDYLAAFDVLLSPRTAGRNVPLKLLDYLKAGRAIVATATEANRQILDGRMAVLTAPAAEAFAAGITRALEDDALRARLGAQARSCLDAQYSHGLFRERLAACYSQLHAPAHAPALAEISALLCVFLTQVQLQVLSPFLAVQ